MEPVGPFEGPWALGWWWIKLMMFEQVVRLSADVALCVLVGCSCVYKNVAVLWHGNFNFVKDRKSAIFGVWAAPGAPETLQKGGAKPPTFWTGLRGPRGRQDPKNGRFPILDKF